MKRSLALFLLLSMILAPTQYAGAQYQPEEVVCVLIPAQNVNRTVDIVYAGTHADLVSIGVLTPTESGEDVVFGGSVVPCDSLPTGAWNPLLSPTGDPLREPIGSPDSGVTVTYCVSGVTQSSSPYEILGADGEPMVVLTISRVPVPGEYNGWIIDWTRAPEGTTPGECEAPSTDPPTSSDLNVAITNFAAVCGPDGTITFDYSADREVQFMVFMGGEGAKVTVGDIFTGQQGKFVGTPFTGEVFSGTLIVMAAEVEDVDWVNAVQVFTSPIDCSTPEEPIDPEPSDPPAPVTPSDTPFSVTSAIRACVTNDVTLSWTGTNITELSMVMTNTSDSWTSGWMPLDPATGTYAVTADQQFDKLGLTATYADGSTTAVMLDVASCGVEGIVTSSVDTPAEAPVAPPTTVPTDPAAPVTPPAPGNPPAPGAPSAPGGSTSQPGGSASNRTGSANSVTVTALPSTGAGSGPTAAWTIVLGVVVMAACVMPLAMRRFNSR